MNFTELQETITGICQPIIDAYEDAQAAFNTYADARGLLMAIEWKTDELGKACAQAREATRWLKSVQAATVESFDAVHALKQIERDYRFSVHFPSSTSGVANYIDTAIIIGQQHFIRGNGLHDSSLAQIAKAIRQYQEDN